MKATFLFVILLSYFGDAAAQEICLNLGDSSISGETYENAPTGTVVATLNFTGDPAEIELYFDEEGNAATYFEVVGSEIKVKDSNLLSRDGDLGEPSNRDSVVITGNIKCNDTGNPTNSNSNVKYDTTITMFYTNNIAPKAKEPYSMEQTEYVAIGSLIFTVTANDGDDTGLPVDLKIESQNPDGYFDINQNGEVTLIKDLDYSVHTSHTITVKLTDTGLDSDGVERSRTANQDFTINILDYDNLPPEFQLAGETFYSANINTNQDYDDPLPIEPQSIEAVDGDTKNAIVTYSFEGGTNNYDSYFDIDSATGEVTLVRSVENTTTFAITVKAAQEDRPSDRFSTTYLQIIASAQDENKPVFDSNSYSGRLLDDGSEMIFVENDGGGLLKLTADDSDGDALLIYSIDPPNSPFQISSQGYIFLQSSTARATTESSFTVTAINVDAEQISVNRKSDPVKVDVTITEVTTQPTTEATTEPATTEGTTFADTTIQPTTEPTTFAETTSVVEMVPASTLYAVAASLSVVLFLAILAIIYLVWRLMRMKKDDKQLLVDPYAKEDDDEESQTASIVHQNGAYVEEDETNSKAGYEEIDAGFMSAASAELVTDLDADLDTFDDLPESQQDAGSIHSALPDPLDTDPHGYQPAEYDGYEDIEDPEDVQQDGEMENEDDEQSLSPFQDELQRRAAQIAVAAAATAMIAKSVETSPEDAESALPRTLQIPPEVVQDEKTIKDDNYSTEKIVTLKGYGDDREDVKAVMKSIDMEMAPSEEVEDMRMQITLLEQLTEMDHPNILKYYGSYEKDGYLHFACKYAQNGSLQDKLRRGKMNDANTLMRIMADIGKGLQYLHAKNITHGNLWSKAIMLDAENNPMLTDIKGDTAVISDYADVMRWQALEVIDQTSGCSPASDVWSYGTLMWEIVSQGAIPYADVPLLELEDKIREQQLPKPKACSESLFSIMTTCWNHDPKRRPDMYVINSNLAEKLLEDSNDHISLELTNYVPAMADESHEHFDDLPPPPSHDSDVADYTAF